MPGEAILSMILTLMRVSVVIFTMPFFSSDAIPVQVKAAFSLVFTLAVWPALSLPGTTMPSHPMNLALMLLGEIILGLVMGMAVNFLFYGIQAGGELLGFQIGFTMVNIADPMTGTQNGAAAYFLWMVSLLTFLSLDGHLHMIKAFAISFQLIPPGGILIGDILMNQVLELSGQLFIMALKIAAPVMVALFLVELGLALMSRAAPNMPVMEIGFPLKICVGFFFIGLLLVVMSSQVDIFITGMDAMFTHLLRAGSPLFHTQP